MTQRGKRISCSEFNRGPDPLLIKIKKFRRIKLPSERIFLNFGPKIAFQNHRSYLLCHYSVWMLFSTLLLLRPYPSVGKYSDCFNRIKGYHNRRRHSLILLKLSLGLQKKTRVLMHIEDSHMCKIFTIPKGRLFWMLWIPKGKERNHLSSRILNAKWYTTCTDNWSSLFSLSYRNE